MLDRLLPEHLHVITASLSRQDIEAAQQVCRAWHDVLEDYFMPQPRALKDLWTRSYASDDYDRQSPPSGAPLVTHIAALCAKPQRLEPLRFIKKGVENIRRLAADLYYGRTTYPSSLEIIEDYLRSSDKTHNYRKLQNIIFFARGIEDFKSRLDMPSDVEAAQHVVDLWEFSRLTPSFFVDLIIDYNPWTPARADNISTIYENQRVKLLHPEQLEVPLVWGLDDHRRPFLAMRVRLHRADDLRISSGIYTFSGRPIEIEDGLDVIYKFSLSKHCDQQIGLHPNNMIRRKPDSTNTLQKIFRTIENYSCRTRKAQDVDVFMCHECLEYRPRDPGYATLY